MGSNERLMGDVSGSDRVRLERGGNVPHFEVATTDGRTVRYADVWQRCHLVLVALSSDDRAQDYGAPLLARAAEFRARDTEVVVTRDLIPRVNPPALIVADRWGEIVHASSLPDSLDVADLLSWAEHLQHRCPECEGEAR